MCTEQRNRPCKTRSSGLFCVVQVQVGQGTVLCPATKSLLNPRNKEKTGVNFTKNSERHRIVPCPIWRISLSRIPLSLYPSKRKKMYGAISTAQIPLGRNRVQAWAWPLSRGSLSYTVAPTPSATPRHLTDKGGKPVWNLALRFPCYKIR